MSATLTARPISPLPNLAAIAVAVAGMLAFCQALGAQQQAARPEKQQKPATEMIRKQDPPKVIPRVLDQATSENVSVYVSLGKQRAYLRVGDEVGIDTPISSGKRAGMTPKGSFVVVQKDPDHKSSLYGAFVDKNDMIVRAGVSAKIDSAPSGTHFKGAPMKWFMRFGESLQSQRAEGMHVGILPGYPASHGCVRLPEKIAPIIYGKVSVGTPVTIGD
ncbi:MAG: L,D-transpeptidase family protein [Verrucomicrobiota bacterium]